MPFDSTTQRYSYVQVVEVPSKSASDLYKSTKAWTKLKYTDDKYILDTENEQLVDLANFSFISVVKSGGFRLPVAYKVIFSLDFYFKEGKTKLVISNIKVIQEVFGTNFEQTLEEFGKSYQKMGFGKNGRRRLVFDVLMTIDENMQNLIAEIDKELKDEVKKTTDW